MREHRAKRPVLTRVVQHIVGEPALYGRLRAERPEKRMRLGVNVVRGPLKARNPPSVLMALMRSITSSGLKVPSS